MASPIFWQIIFCFKNSGNNEKIIDKDSAIAGAVKSFHGFEDKYYPFIAEHHIVTADDCISFPPEALDKNSKLKDKQYLDKLPVYIVVFKDNLGDGSGPYGYKGPVYEG